MHDISTMEKHVAVDDMTEQQIVTEVTFWRTFLKRLDKIH